MDKYLRILIIEDSEDDLQFVLRELRNNNYEVEYERVETPAAMDAALDRKQWDLILCDYSLPHFNAPHALRLVQTREIDIPFIILSGTIGEETAIAALKAGAHDFLIKGNYHRLSPAIERELREVKIRREHRQAVEALIEKEHLLSEAQRIGHIGSWSYHIPGDVFSFSEEMYRLLDIPAKGFKLNQASFKELIYSSDRPLAEKWMKDMKIGRQSRELGFRILRKNGELRHMHCRGVTLFDEYGNVLRFVGTMQDVTESRLAEIQIHQQLDRLLALRRIDQAIASTFSLHTILNTVLIQTLEQLHVDAAAILLYNQETQILEYAAGRGFKSSAIQKTHNRFGEGHAGRAISEGRMIHVPDLHEKPQLRSMPEEGFVCYFGVPLIAKSSIKGVLEIFHRSHLQPYPEWIDFLETLGGQAAIAIDNANLFENLQQSNLDLALAYDATIEGWSRALDLRDHETEGHTQRVTEMTLELAHRMNIDSDQLIHIKRGGLLHDIGKMGIPDRILMKEEELTESEWMIMRQHPQFAFELLNPIAYLKPALDIPYCHHEKWDGTGYPRGLKGEEIPLVARIFAIVDVWDAFTMNRPYRKAWTQERTLEYIRTNSGTHFDPRIVAIFLGYMSDKTKGNRSE